MMTDKKFRVIIADDEPLARQRLLDLLNIKQEIEIAAVAGNGQETINAIRTENADIIFLDIQMPGMTGLEIIQEIGPEHMPAIIFTTAYDQYALHAFDSNALDYLLKPFDDERFEQALAKAKKSIGLSSLQKTTTKLLSIMGNINIENRNTNAQSSYLERIAVELRGQIQVVVVDNIEYITASGPYAELHSRDKTYLIRERMQTLDERLDPARFYRIHRSTIVKLDCVDSLSYNPGGDYSVRLKNGQQFRLSRNRRNELEERLGITIK